MSQVTCLETVKLGLEKSRCNK